MIKKIRYLALLLFLVASFYNLSGQENSKNTSYNDYKNWVITSLGHFDFQVTNTVGLPDKREGLFSKFPFELTLGEAAVSFYKGKVGIGTYVFRRETSYHDLIKDKNPFFKGVGKTTWLPVIIRVPVIIDMQNNWFKGASVKYELSTIESFKSDSISKQYYFNSHRLALELNTQGSIIELGYCYHQQISADAYFLPGKNYVYLKIGLGIMGNYFWNWRLRKETIKQRP